MATILLDDEYPIEEEDVEIESFYNLWKDEFQFFNEVIENHDNYEKYKSIAEKVYESVRVYRMNGIQKLANQAYSDGHTDGLNDSKEI